MAFLLLVSALTGDKTAAEEARRGTAGVSESARKNRFVCVRRRQFTPGFNTEISGDKVLPTTTG